MKLRKRIRGGCGPLKVVKLLENDPSLTFSCTRTLNGDLFVTTFLHFISRTKAPMEWSEAHDVFLCREMLAVNPFKAKRKTTQRTKMWETLFNILNRLTNLLTGCQCDLFGTVTSWVRYKTKNTSDP